MKNSLQHPTLLGLAFTLALVAAPVAALAQTAEPAVSTPAPAPRPSVSVNVSGKVEAKSDSTITVGGRMVSINSATTFSRAGASIGSGDVKVGDKVNVVTTDNGQVAVSVEVLSSE